MKLKKVKFNNHKMLGNLEINFQDANKNILDTVVLIGLNGVGKTTILEEIYNLLDVEYAINSESKLSLTLNNGEGIRIDKKYDTNKLPNSLLTTTFDQNTYEVCFLDGIYDIEKTKLDVEKTYNKVVYMPAEINFDLLNKVDRTFKYVYKFRNKINQNVVSDLPSAIANAINTEVFKNEDLPPKQSIKKICDEVNYLFECMELDVKLIGLSKDEDNKPIFEDITGNKFDIKDLSSGEKQLFLRALSLKFLDVNNSIILIDEPEISLHPQWQKNIIKIYENIGKNNQLIIATHSPHIVGDIKKEQLRVLRKDENGVSIVNNDKLDETYGHTVESILKSTMELKSVRNDETEENLKKIRNMLKEELYETNEFKETYENLKTYLGDLDIDLNLIDLDIKRRKRKKEK